jgi:hypothetical protein
MLSLFFAEKRSQLRSWTKLLVAKLLIKKGLFEENSEFGG